MTSEDEKQFILLSAILLSDGGGSKQKILDAVDRLGLMEFLASDLQMRQSRNELAWRNDLAFIRSHLVKAGCIANHPDSWDITPKGKQRAVELVKRVASQRNFNHFNKAALPKIEALLFFEPLSDSSAISGETELAEGGKSLRWTTIYERNPQLRAEAINIHGLACKGCGFDFEKKYGPIGKGFIEVHHLNPISEQGGQAAVNPRTDLTVLCSNCHSIVHRNRPKPLTLAELAKIAR